MANCWAELVFAPCELAHLKSFVDPQGIGEGISRVLIPGPMKIRASPLWFRVCEPNKGSGGAPRDSAGSGATEEGLTSRGCSCLENPRDGGALWAAVYGVAQSRTRLKRLSSSSSSSRNLG